MKTETFVCGLCQQPILCTQEHSGKIVGCPRCGGNVQLPEFASPPIKRAKRLAIASMLLSLSSFVTGPFGFVPGTICGHLALRRAKNSGTTDGKGFARTGLVAGYLCLLVALVLFALLPATVLALIGTSTAKTKPDHQELAVQPVGKTRASSGQTVEVEFGGFEQTGFGERGIVLVIRNGFAKPVTQLEMVYAYLDSHKKVLKEFPMNKSADDLAAPASTNKVVSMAFFLPPETHTVDVRLKKVTFVDGSVWQPQR